MDSGLYVVATAIGNFGDMSQRAIEVLQNADLIAAEDTRHSQRLLQFFAIDTPIMAYHDHSDDRALQRIDRCLAEGGRVALVSDAGTPLISDPGYRLVRHVQDSGFAVYPLPGPCAAIAALSVSGLPTDRFLFEGFLPAREGARGNRLAALAAEPMTLIFYEAPHRVDASLQAMVAAFGGDREAVLARELTKTFETIKRGPLSELAQFVSEDNNQQKGEIVLIVAGQPKVEQDIDAQVSALLQRLAQELPAKKAAAVVADWSGLRKKQLYEHLLALKQE
ncbi:Ribosomal RNA small subunit methyltransferase I [Halioglobus japonicus]|nr:Ribosomal RNA small subunit methyltransferase I [Halioglobus japonicus]